MITIKTYNIIDLFSGAGGLSLGFKQTGKINIVAAAENNPNARKTYKRNFAEVKRLYPDVRTIDYNELKEAVGQVDIVIGGPPCQGFSNANRQHSTIISMNNRLVKEYVRAICELQPTAFVMENVAMLKSQVHRFFLEENDMTNAKILNLPLREDNIEILPQNMNFEGSRELILSAPNGVQYAWAETFYKTINLLYRYRINQPKFDLSLTKYEKKLVPQLQELFRGFNGTESSNRIQQKDSFMAIQILNYIENKEKREESFDRVIQAIRDSLLIQRALLKVKELSDNNIHVFDYVEKDGGLYATVKSYSVLDYLQGILENEPYNYTLKCDTLMMVSLAPVPMATWGNHEQSHVGQNYLKSLFALGFQGFLILICVAIYAVLIQNIAISGDAIGSIWSIVGYTVLLCFSLFKTSSVAKTLLGAH